MLLIHFPFLELVVTELSPESPLDAACCPFFLLVSCYLTVPELNNWSKMGYLWLSSLLTPVFPPFPGHLRV